VTRYVIVPERSRVDVTARPSLPGVRMVVEEISGTVDHTPSDGGGGRAEGRLTLWLQAIIDDDIRSLGVPAWLRAGDLVGTDGRLEAARCDGEGHLDVKAQLRVQGRSVPLTGAGRVAPTPDDDQAWEAVGVTIVDPRALGFALPPLVTYVLHARWRIRLVPTHDGPPR
jgi:hypothetical protein